MPLTENTPKCYAEIHGRRLLEWAIDAFKAASISDICFIGGYQIEKVRCDYPQLTFRHNREWEQNNILLSLMHAEDLMDQGFVCCYSDILFTSDIIRAVVEHPRDIVLSVDTRWLDRYRDRTQHPPTDAEKVMVLGDLVTRVHREIAPERAHGEYTGIAKFTAAGAMTLREHFQRAQRAFAGKPFREAALFERAYLILLFQEMIEAGVAISHADTAGDYMEVDTQEDFELAQRDWHRAARAFA